MKYVITLYVLIFFHSLNAQRWQNAVQLNGTGMERAWDIVTLPSNYSVVTGQFTDTLFTLTDTLICRGISDIFISVFTPEGENTLTRAFGGKQEDVSITAGCDENGNIYFAGYYNDSAWFGNQLVVSDGAWGLYLCKINSSGEVAWVRTASGSQSEIIYGIAVSPAGNIGFTGWFQDTVRFDNGQEVISFGGSDILAGCFNTDGQLQWLKHAGSAGVDYGYKAAFDTDENLYITGVASGNIQFDSLMVNIGSMFVAKYNQTGQIKWICPASGGVSVNSIAVDDEGNGYVCGRYQQVGIFNDHIINSFQNSDDAYVARFSNNGQWQWAVTAGGKGSDKGRALTLAKDGSALFTGSFTDTLPVLGFELTAAGADDIFIGQISPDGELLWVNTAGGTFSDIATGISLLNDSLIVSCGWYTGYTIFGSQQLNAQTGNINFFVSYNLLNLNHIHHKGTFIPVFPNPAKKMLYIPLKSVIKPTFYTLAGFKIDCPITIFNENYWIADVSALKAGMYFIQSGNQVSKVMIGI